MPDFFRLPGEIMETINNNCNFYIPVFVTLEITFKTINSMKTLLITAFILFFIQVSAQNITPDTTKQEKTVMPQMHKSVENDTLIAKDNPDSLQTKNLQGNISKTDKDTTRIVLGKKIITLIKDKEGNSQVIISDEKGNVQFSEDDEDFHQDDFDNDDDHKDKHEKKHKKFDGHWNGIEFGMNNYLNSKNSTVLESNEKHMELYANKSWEFNLNLFEQNIPLYKKNIGLVTGLGFQFNNYRFENTNYLMATDSPYYVIDTVNTYKKNKLATTYLVLPLILEFQIPVGEKERALFFGLGATGSVKLGSHTKLIDNNDDKKKTHKDYNLSPFRYGLTARMGFGGLNLYANYSMVPLFEKNRGPELYPFSVGLSFTGNF